MKLLTKDPSVHWSSAQQKLATDRPLPKIQSLGFQKTRWGWFPWQNEAMEDMVHPFDVCVAARFIPGPRILTINSCPCQPKYLRANYGHLSFRFLPTLWRQTPAPGAALGDMVEISQLFSPRQPLLATVEEIFWDNESESMKYQFSNRGKMLPEWYHSHQFQLVKRVA